MRAEAYIKSAAEIITLYKGEVPFAAWIKSFFAANKKYGSKDRRYISHLCYSCFRLGHAFARYSTEERIRIGLLLTAEEFSPLLETLPPEWRKVARESVREKLLLLQAEDEVLKITNMTEAISPEVEREKFSVTLLKQPHLYLRLRPGKEERAKEKLKASGITFNILAPHCLQLPNGTKLDGIVSLDEEAVIQDYNSQKVIDPLLPYLPVTKKRLQVWDACAASGGKSMLASDKIENLFLTVSDVRQSILFNLQNRFKRAGITQYKSFVADVSQPNFSPFRLYDVVICDAPCSGSGTWSRTPEQTVFFKKEKLGYYASLQKKICGNAARAVAKGGLFIYITCSVFTEENEEVVKHLKDNTSLQLLTMQYFKGYEQKADTLFVAVFRG